MDKETTEKWNSRCCRPTTRNVNEKATAKEDSETIQELENEMNETSDERNWYLTFRRLGGVKKHCYTRATLSTAAPTAIQFVTCLQESTCGPHCHPSSARLYVSQSVCIHLSVHPQICQVASLAPPVPCNGVWFTSLAKKYFFVLLQIFLLYRCRLII